MTIFLMSFLGCLAAVALWKMIEKRHANPNPIKPIVVHEVFDKSTDGVSHTSTAFIDPNTRRFEIKNRFETASGVRIYEYRFINGAVYARLVDDYDDSYHRSPRTLLYDVYEGFILEEDFRARRAKGFQPEKADEEIEYMKAEIVWHRLSPDAFNSISSVLAWLIHHKLKSLLKKSAANARWVGVSVGDPHIGLQAAPLASPIVFRDSSALSFREGVVEQARPATRSCRARRLGRDLEKASRWPCARGYSELFRGCVRRS